MAEAELGRRSNETYRGQPDSVCATFERTRTAGDPDICFRQVFRVGGKSGGVLSGSPVAPVHGAFYRNVWTAVPTSKVKEVAAMLKAIAASATNKRTSVIAFNMRIGTGTSSERCAKRTFGFCL
jgi:hypothetical protein